MPPRPILFVDHARALGGAQRVLLDLFRFLDRARWELHLACPEGDLAVRAHELGVTVHHQSLERLRTFPPAFVNFPSGAVRLARIARRMEAAAIYANTVRAAWYGAAAGALARRPFIWHVHDFYLSEVRPAYPRMDRLGKRMLMAVAVGVIANSHATAAELPGSPRKIRVVHNGIDASRHDSGQDGSEFRRAWGIPADAPVAGMLGRLRPWKGQLRFLEMAAAVLPEIPDAFFVIAGGDPFRVDDGYVETLHAASERLEIADRVVFCGHLDDVRPALAAIDVFVHPGDAEPFGLVNLEAMAMGKPVVAFAHGALSEIVVQEQTGLLVSPNDMETLAEAVAALLRDQPRRKRMGAAGRTRVIECFTVQRMAVGVASKIDEVLQQRR